MATKLDKPLSRQLAQVYKEREVVVTMLPKGGETYRPADMLEFRLKGTQQKWKLSMDQVFLFVRQQDRDMLTMT